MFYLILLLNIKISNFPQYWDDKMKCCKIENTCRNKVFLTEELVSHLTNENLFLPKIKICRVDFFKML